MIKRKSKTTAKERIINSAIDVFYEKGKHGASMEEIGLRAGINKAMLYYYFGTKDNLYVESLAKIISSFSSCISGKVEAIRNASKDAAQILKSFACAHLDTFDQYPKYTRVFLEAITVSPDEIPEMFRRSGMKFENLNKMVCLFETAGNRQEFRRIDPRQVLVSIIGMNLIHIAAMPIINMLLGLNDTDHIKFMKNRKKSIVDLMLYGVLERKI